MIIYPAIDLYNGQCVRLYQGNYKQETVYSTNPVAMIEQFVTEGAAWLHIVDLTGAKNPQNNQVTLINELIKTNNINIQVGGGIRTKKQVEALLKQGAKRVIVGSLAVKKPREVKQWLMEFGNDSIILAVDIRCNETQQPIIAINGWQSLSHLSLYELIDDFQSAGLKHILCTDISRDGTLSGPNYELYNLKLGRLRPAQPDGVPQGEKWNSPLGSQARVSRAPRNLMGKNSVALRPSFL